MARTADPTDPRNNRNAIIDRSQFERQLYDAQGKPTATMYAFAGRMHKEVGPLGREAQMAWAESVFNRSAARGHTIDYELRNHGSYSYWPRNSPEPGHSTNPEYIDTINKVFRNGTNLSLGATGNASENVGVGRETYRTRGERFGVESGDSSWWNSGFGKLVKGVGRFIGDVASAVGRGIATVAGAVVDGARWVMHKVSDAFSPSHPTHQQPAYPSQRPAERPAERFESQRAPSTYSPQRPPEPRVITPQPPVRMFKMHDVNEPMNARPAQADPRPPLPPRP